MKKILKMFGLPRTGTCVMQHLLNFNFTNYVCQPDDFLVDLYGWKHGTPKTINDYRKIQQITNQELLFVFTNREFESWRQAVIKDHIGSWEFPEIFYRPDTHLIFNTPVGPEIYNDFKHLYNTKMNIYKLFCLQHHTNTIMIDFVDIKNDKIKVLEQIKNKFNLQPAESHWITLNKKYVRKNGNLFDI
jgi:hypothetical protein